MHRLPNLHLWDYSKPFGDGPGPRAAALSVRSGLALAGVEAVSNGVPNFKPPKSRNAANTLAVMGAITIAMFAGITSP